MTLAMPVRRPASYYQRDWVLACRDRQSFHSLPLAWELRGPLDVAALLSAVSGLVHRHDALRTAFAPRGDDVDQLVWPMVDYDLSIVDGLDESAVADRIVVEAERARLVDAAPLWHGLLFRLGPQRHVLALFVHHLIFDGWSHGVLHDELVRCYRGATNGHAPRLPALNVQAGDHADWERGRRDEAVEQWWRENLRDLPPLSALPRPGGRFISAPLAEVSPARVERLRALAAEHGAGLNTALLATVLVARRASTGDDAVIGITRAGRDRPELQRVVGPLLDHIPVRVRMAGARSFGDILGRTHRAHQEAVARALPLGRIRQVVPDDLTDRGGRLYDTRYNYLPNTATRRAVVSTSDGTALELAPFAVDPLRLAPRHTEDHPEVLPLSFILRRNAGGDVGGEVCGHDGTHPPASLAAIAHDVDAALAELTGPA